MPIKKILKLSLISMLSAFVLLVVFQNCSPNEFTIDDESKDDRFETIDLNTTSTTSIVDHKLVIIFDNSPSMADELTRVIAALDGYFENMRGQANFDVVVYTTNSYDTHISSQGPLKRVTIAKYECFDISGNIIPCTNTEYKKIRTHALAPPAAIMNFDKNLSPTEYNNRKTQLINQLQTLIPTTNTQTSEFGLCSIIRAIHASKATPDVFKLSPNDFVNFLIISDENDSTQIDSCTDKFIVENVNSQNMFHTKMDAKAIQVSYTAHGTADGGSTASANIDGHQTVCDIDNLGTICIPPYTSSGTCSAELSSYLLNSVAIGGFATVTSISNCTYHYVTQVNRSALSINQSSLANPTQNICLGGSFSIISNNTTYSSISEYVTNYFPTATNITCELTTDTMQAASAVFYNGYSYNSDFQLALKNNLNSYLGANKYNISAVVYNTPSTASCPITIGSEGVRYREFISLFNPEVSKTFSICLSDYQPIFNHIQDTIVSISSRTYPVTLRDNEIMVAAYIKRNGTLVSLTSEQYSFSYEPTATVTIADGILQPTDQIVVRIRKQLNN